LALLSLAEVTKDASFGFGACLHMESRFLSMLFVDKLDLNLADNILLHPLFRVAREDIAFPLSATFCFFSNLFVS